jgi:hypothetical protein
MRWPAAYSSEHSMNIRQKWSYSAAATKKVAGDLWLPTTGFKAASNLQKTVTGKNLLPPDRARQG